MTSWESKYNKLLWIACGIVVDRHSTSWLEVRKEVRSSSWHHSATPGGSNSHRSSDGYIYIYHKYPQGLDISRLTRLYKYYTCIMQFHWPKHTKAVVLLCTFALFLWIESTFYRDVKSAPSCVQAAQACLEHPIPCGHYFVILWFGWAHLSSDSPDRFSYTRPAPGMIWLAWKWATGGSCWTWSLGRVVQPSDRSVASRWQKMCTLSDHAWYHVWHVYYTIMVYSIHPKEVAIASSVGIHDLMSAEHCNILHLSLANASGAWLHIKHVANAS